MNQKNTTQKDDELSAIHRFFNDRKVRKIFLTLRVPVALALVFLLSLHIKKEYFWMGFAISAIGEFIQVWCFSALKKKKILAVKGPYVLVRNPMYLGRYLILLGFLLLMGPQFYIWIVGFTVIYYLYMVNRVRREEKVLVEIFGESYLEYCRNVNRFFSSFRNVDWKSLPYFRKELFFRNNAHWNILATLICYTFFYYMTFIRK